MSHEPPRRLADPCTGARWRDFLLGLRRGQPIGAHVPSWCSRHGVDGGCSRRVGPPDQLTPSPTRRPWMVQGGRPQASMYQNPGRWKQTGRTVRDERYHDRFGHGKDGLFAKDKFCLIRRGQLVLPQRGARSGADRALPDAGSAVPKGSRPFGVDHEAAAVGGSPAAGRPSDGATAVGQGLSVASAGDHRAHRPACCSGHSAGRRGGEPSCK
jgi:hypothetical protein